jgi:multidrug efflux pump subunit AcrA (membrane-fusion protein)
MKTLLMFLGGLAAASAFAAEAPPATTQSATVIVPASIEAFEQADLYAKTAGYLSEIKVDIGDHVKAGAVLAVIDSPELESELSAAQATLVAKRELANAANASIEQAQTALRVSKSQLAGYQADLKLADATFKRQEELYAGKAITEQQLDDARTKAQVSRTQAEVGEAKIAAAEADVRAAEANHKVAVAQVGVAEAEAKRFETLLRYTKITAPFDGVIARRLVNRGDLAPAGTGSRTSPLFTLQQISTVRVVCEVPESSAARIANGSGATVKLFGLDGQTMEGKVTRFAASLNPETRTMRTEIDLKNSDEKLRPGMYAQVTLTLTPPATTGTARRD